MKLTRYVQFAFCEPEIFSQVINFVRKMYAWWGPDFLQGKELKRALKPSPTSMKLCKSFEKLTNQRVYFCLKTLSLQNFNKNQPKNSIIAIKTFSPLTPFKYSPPLSYH